MKSKEIRESFLEYFKEHNHSIVPSSSLIPEDPTLLLTAAGMVQFKPIFLGKIKPDFTRAASCQKCVRTTDIEKVGLTARHLTFFEMLGNFSFGDYYKKEAISWAWEFLTEKMGLEKEKLWVTIFREDEEAYQIWRDLIKIPDKKIVRMGEEDNFWAAGSTGPCGPCSELIYDLGEERSCRKPDCGIGCDCDRFLEVWNLVFMEFERGEDGELNPLPQKNIDTGMGLERIALIKQNVTSTFETDLMKPIVEEILSLTKEEKGAISTKIIADHVRAITFLVNDGVIPSNEGRGYILRRLLRRAVRHGRLLGIEKIFLPHLVDKVIKVMVETYSDLKTNAQFIKKIVQKEEERFSHTLKQGLNMLSEIIKKAHSQKLSTVPANFAFVLYDTYGFPFELTREILAESSLSVSEEDYQKLMEEQREKSRQSFEGKTFTFSKDVYRLVTEKFGPTEFVGYAELETTSNVKAIIKGENMILKAKEGEEVEIILDKTPFYAEMGGQVGDKGQIITDTGIMEIYDTTSPFPSLYTHKGKVVSGYIEVETSAKGKVNQKRRQSISSNHTATHLLHWALRIVLGEHVKQSGSLVDDKKLRFDFTHFEALTPEQIIKVEKLVNSKIFENHPVRAYITSMEFAKEIGVIALFGEKYGDFVRVVEVGNFSKELCGGTHVTRSSDIGLFKIVSEGSIGANLRRIEALTLYEALNFVYKEEELYRQISRTLKAPFSEVPAKVDFLITSLKEKDRELERLKKVYFAEKVERFLKEAVEVNETKVVVEKLEVEEAQDLKILADALRSRVEKGIFLFGASIKGKAILLSAATPSIVLKGFHAGELVENISGLVRGGGGGKADLAEAGGKSPEKIDEALKVGKEKIINILRKIKS